MFSKKSKEMMVVFFAIGVIVLFTYIQSYLSKTTSFGSGNIIVLALMNLNIVLLILVIFLVTRNTVKLFLERKRGMMGSKLRTKLVMAFVSLSIIPTMFLFVLSVIFVYRSMEGWLSHEVERAIDESMKVAKIYYKEASTEAIHFATFMSNEITERRLLKEGNMEILKALLHEKMDLFRLSAVEILSAQGEVLVKLKSTDLEVNNLNMPRLEAGTIKSAIEGKPVSTVITAGNADLIEGLVPIKSSYNPQDIVAVLVVDYYIPESITARLGIIESTFEEYIDTLKFKGPIKTWYIIILSTVTLLVIFSAVWFGINISKGLTTPIEKLVEGTERISMGDLGFTLEVQSNDELGILVKDFNHMVGELRDSRKNLESAYNELTYRNDYIRTVLNNVSTGVISINSSDCISMINPSAQSMLAIKTEKVIGRPFREVLKEEHMPIVDELVGSLRKSKSTTAHQEINLTIEGKRLILLVYASLLFDDNRDYMGMVVVFDDLTEMQRMQRVAAWREVARRIAHEVKNPLTPIQLSAQRLRRKYLEKLGGDSEVFDECTKVIINQVEEMRALVDEFSAFAKMPASMPAPGDLNAALEDAVALYRQAHPDIEFIIEPDDKLPSVMIDKSQMARAIGNLIENAINAVKSNESHIKTIKLATSTIRELSMVRLEIIDNGPGIPKAIKERIFEPYFSTKKGGTGLGLVIVRSIINDHGGFIRVRDNDSGGTIISMEFPVKEWA